MLGEDIPGVSEAEWTAAFRVVEQDPSIKMTSKVINGMFQAMPPTTVDHGERLINVGIADPATARTKSSALASRTTSSSNTQIMPPPTALATPDACGIVNAGQAPTQEGLAGQATLTVNDSGGNPLWEMLIIRPSSSSGAPVSVQVLKFAMLDIKVKSVLKRAHVPILNVKYVNGCGPFRDWQFSEEFFNAPEAGSQNRPTRAASAIRILAPGQVATTVVETRNDTGNFRGVAIYTQNTENGQEVVLVTELNASWYRYIMEWRFATDEQFVPGTVLVRLGRIAVSASNGPITFTGVSISTWSAPTTVFT